MTRRQLIRKMLLARHVHAGWAKEQAAWRRLGLRKARLVGGETFHRDWVKVYDEAVRALKKKN